MITKKHRMTTIFGSLVIMGLSVSQLQAGQDGKTYPDSMCRAPLPEDAKFFSGTRNIDPEDRHYLECPIVRDSTEDGLYYASITVVDESPEDDLACTLSSRTPKGATLRSKSVKSFGASSTPQLLRFGSFPPPTYGGGFYEISCHIPNAEPNGSGGYKYSYIVAYRVDEYTE
jgi:hypothetical protein